MARQTKQQPSRKPLSTTKDESKAREATKKKQPQAFTKSRWPRKLKFTREGKYFLGITLGVGFAAINTGNNLLYLLLGMMLSLIIVSGVMSELSLRNLKVKRRLPQRAQVGRSHLVEIEVYNDKGRAPSYAIEVEDLRASHPADKRCFFLKISPHSTQVAAYRRSPAKRGVENHVGFRVATRFPFGLFEKSRELEAADELIIYPAVDGVRLPNRGQGEPAGEHGPLARGHGQETFGLRAMREGDDPRDIYWRKSTLMGQMVLRERARETQRQIELILETRMAKQPPSESKNKKVAAPEDTLASNNPFEIHVRDIASRAVAHLRRGDGVRIRTTTGKVMASHPSHGLDPVLRFLALVQQEPETETNTLASSKKEAAA